MKIYLLRHTTLDIENDIFYGQSDVNVSQNFFNEVGLIRKKLKRKKIDLKKMQVFVSPLKRCVKLADEFFNNYEEDTRLKELNFGDWEMKSFRKIPEFEIKSWEKDLMNYKIPNGESNAQFFNRLSSFCNEKINGSKDIFIVAHAGTINCIISYLTKIPFPKLIKDNWKRITHGSLSLVEKKDNYRIIYLGK